jgi:hypothetical protein
MIRAVYLTASLATLGLASLVPAAVRSGSSQTAAIAKVDVQCMGASDDCRTRIIRLPDGQPGQVLKFEYCREGDCDRSHREHWVTHYLVPPPGEVCRNTDITEALHWMEQNRPGWLLAGWGCVSSQRLPA